MWQVTPLTDKGQILAFLQQDRIYAAYAIGDLEPSLFAHCQWFGAEDDGEVIALALFFTGLQPPALFTMGDANGLAAILASALQPRRAYFTCRAEHLPVVEAFYALDEVEKMFRMALASADFRRVPGPTIKLDISHLDALRQLYRLGGGDAFAPYQLRDGVYSGVEADGHLVSAAGTHLIAPSFGVAAVGNIFTHPNHRRRGHGTACTSHVVEELLAQGLDVVLNVNRENTKAIGIYEKLGFRKHCPYIEVIGNRKQQIPNIQTKEDQMRNIILESLSRIPVGEQQVELVERKGVGHPDSICDAIMEAISVELCRAYLDTFGRILHHNIDKGLLVAGRTSPRLGGGTVEEPMRLVFGDRAIYEAQGKRIPVGDIAEATAKAWLRSNLRFVDVDKHIVFQNEIKPGSPELTDIFERDVIGANDTSAGVGYAPLTDTEELVLATERHLNSTAFKATFPEAGEDIKVMGYRHDHELVLTIAIAFVDRFIPTEEAYYERKAAIQADVEEFVARQQHTIEKVVVDINTLDEPSRGEGGMYLTVLGTSAEGGDCGQVGRGNKVNGVIALNRPMSTEAAAGKNPVSHVGKIYSLLSHGIAAQVHATVPGIREVYIWLCSQIGHPIDQPLIASAQLILEPGLELEPVRGDVEAVIENELANIYDFTARLARGEFMVW